jgi:hypothetical protein
MEESTKKKWGPMAGVFLAVFGSFAALMYLSIRHLPSAQSRFISPSFSRFQQPQPHADDANDIPERISRRPPPGPVWVKRTLGLDRQHRVGNILLTYRGLEEGSFFKLDAVIPALDPAYAYKMKLSISEGKKGFRRGGDRFVLLFAGRSKIRLLHRTMP